MSHKHSKTISLLIIITFILCPTNGYSLPEGEQVVAGSAGFDRSQENTLNINQSTDKLIANYNSFSIAQPETVNFLQPSSSSIALNRVVGADPSQILGTLSANGRIFLVNPNGVLFGQGCRVDTAGMLASTLDISDNDFLAGRYTFFGQGGSVVNQGYITAPGGFVYLLGSTVENTGVIESELGSIALASGDAVTLNLDSQGLISVVIDDETSLNIQGKDAAVKNTGTLSAEGGKVILTAETLDGIFDKAINTEGIIEADALNGSAGLIELSTNANASSTGTMSAEGGTINICADGILSVAGEYTAESVLFDPEWVTQTGPMGFSADTEFWSNGNIDVTDTISVSGPYSLTLRADNDNNKTGNLNIYGDLLLHGGDLYLYGANILIDDVNVQSVGDPSDTTVSFYLNSLYGNVDNYEEMYSDTDSVGRINIIDSIVTIRSDNAQSGIIEMYAGSEINIDNSNVLVTTSAEDSNAQIGLYQYSAMSVPKRTYEDTGISVNGQGMDDGMGTIRSQVGEGSEQTDGNAAVIMESDKGIMIGDMEEDEDSSSGYNTSIQAKVSGEGNSLISMKNTNMNGGHVVIDNAYVNSEVYSSFDDGARIDLGGVSTVVAADSYIRTNVSDHGYSGIQIYADGDPYENVELYDEIIPVLPSILIDASRIYAGTGREHNAYISIYGAEDVNIVGLVEDTISHSWITARVREGQGTAETYVRSENGDILIENSNLYSQIASGFDSSYLGIFAFDGTVDIEDSDLQALVDYSGDAEISVESDESITITGSDLTAFVQEEGEAEISISIDENGSEGREQILVENSDLTARVGGEGSANVGIAIGSDNDSEEDWFEGDIIVRNNSDISALVEKEADSEDNDSEIDFEATTITIEDSNLTSRVILDPGACDPYAEAQIDLDAYGFADDDVFVLIDNSEILSEVTGGNGTARVNIGEDRVGYRFYTNEGYEDFDEYEEYSGGEIIIRNNSLVKAKTDSGFNTADVSLYALDITLDNSDLIAEVLYNGNSRVRVRALDYTYQHVYDKSQKWIAEGGTLDIINNSNIQALVGTADSTGSGIAEIELKGSDVTLSGASDVLAKVFGVGESDARVDISAGDHYEAMIAQHNSEDFCRGSLEISEESSVTASTRMGPAGSRSEVEMESWDIDILDSTVRAEVLDGGLEVNRGEASVEINAGEWHEYSEWNEDQTYYYESEIFDGGYLDLKNSSIEALVEGTPETENDAHIMMAADQMTIDNSDVMSDIKGTGDASVELLAAYYYFSDWEHEFTELENDWEYKAEAESNEDSECGRIDILNTSNVSAIVDGSQDHEHSTVGIFAGDIMIENSNVLADMTGYGGSRVEISAGNNYYHYESEEYLNNPSMYWDDHTAAGNYQEWEDFYGGYLEIYDSSVAASVVRAPDMEGDKETEALVDLYAENILTGNSDISASFRGKGKSEVYAYATGISHSYLNENYEFYFENDDFIQDYETNEDFLANTPGVIEITDSSNVSAVSTQDEAEVYLEIGSDEMIVNAVMDVRNGIDPGYITIKDSTVLADVNGEGLAGIYIYDEYNRIDALVWIDDCLGLGLKGLIEDIGGPVGGRINVWNSTVHAEAESSEPDDTALVYMNSAEAITLESSGVSAEEETGIAAVVLLAENAVSSTGGGKGVSSSVNDGLAVSLAIAPAGIHIEDPFTADGGEGVGISALLSFSDIYAGDVSAYGDHDLIKDLEYMIDELFVPVGIGAQYGYGGIALVSSLAGDIYAGDMDADMVILAALGMDELSACILDEDFEGYDYGAIFDVPGTISAHYLGLLARNDIGTEEGEDTYYAGPLTTDVDIVSGYSFDKGNIYIKEANDIEAGLVLPLYDPDCPEEPVLKIGASLAANDGVISVISKGDMLVNSVIAPRAGVFLQSETGSIYAGQALMPVVDQDQVDDLGEFASYILDDLFGWEIDPEMIADLTGEALMDLEGTVWNYWMGMDYFTPVSFVPEGEYTGLPNIIAGTYSYISTPQGTIGVGMPGDKDPAISGEIYGEVMPGVEAVTGLYPAPGIDLSRYTPPGLVYFCGTGETARIKQTDNGDHYYGSQIWPETIADPEISSENPLVVLAYVDECTMHDYRALPEWFLESLEGTEDPISALTLEIGPPVLPPPSPAGDGAPFNVIPKNYRIYYELTNRYRVVNSDPAQPTEYYAYHPLTPADTSAFDDIALDAGAYDFIADRINYRRPLAPYFGEEEEDERRRR